MNPSHRPARKAAAALARMDRIEAEIYAAIGGPSPPDRDAIFASLDRLNVARSVAIAAIERHARFAGSWLASTTPGPSVRMPMITIGDVAYYVAQEAVPPGGLGWEPAKKISRTPVTRSSTSS